MDPRDILSLQMEYHFGAKVIAKSLLKEKVNAALDSGEWHEDFDIAVTRTELDDEDAKKLLSAVLKAYPSCVLNVDGLKAIIDEQLPHASLDITWLVGPDCALVLADPLRVAKVQGDTLAWVTKQVSWDGIALEKVEDGVIFGSWYDYSRPTDEWQPLKLLYSDGSLLEGEEVSAVPKRSQGYWVYQDFTCLFDEPFTIEVNEEGLYILYTYTLLSAKRLEIEAGKDGWQLAEHVDFADLIQSGRIHKRIKSGGLFGRKQYWTVESVTLRFKRWVE